MADMMNVEVVDTAIFSLPESMIDNARLTQKDIIFLSKAFESCCTKSWDDFAERDLKLTRGDIINLKDGNSTRASKIIAMFQRWIEVEQGNGTFKLMNDRFKEAKLLGTQQLWWNVYRNAEDQKRFNGKTGELKEFCDNLADCAITEEEWTKFLIDLKVDDKENEVNEQYLHNKYKQRRELLHLWEEWHGYSCAIRDLKNSLKKVKLRRVICQIAGSEGGSKNMHKEFVHFLEDEWDHIFDMLDDEQKDNVFDDMPQLENNRSVDDAFNNVMSRGNAGFHSFIETLVNKCKFDLSRLGDSKHKKLFDIKKLHSQVPHFKETEAYKYMKDNLKQNRLLELWGLPGCGKSQFAAAYAKEFRSSHPTSLIWFFECKGDDDSLASLREALVDAQIYQNNVSDERKIKCMCEAIKNSEMPVLLVLEDLYKKKIVPSLKTLIRELKNYDKAYILATSRTRDSTAELKFSQQQLAGFTSQEAIEFLEPKEENIEEQQAAKNVAALYSNLPLGLAPAKAYCKENDLSYVKYCIAMEQELNTLKFIKEQEDEWIKDFYDTSEKEAGKNILATMILALSTLESTTLSQLTVNFQEIFSYSMYFNHEHIPVYLFKQLMTQPDILTNSNQRENISDLHCEIATKKLLKQVSDSSLGVVAYDQSDVYLSTLSTHRVVVFALKYKYLQKEQDASGRLVNALYALSCYFQKDNRLVRQHNQLLTLMPHVTKALSWVDIDANHTKAQNMQKMLRDMLVIRLLELKGFACTQTDAQKEAESPLKEAHDKLLQLLCDAGHIPVSELDSTVAERVLEGNGPDTFIETKARVLYQFCRDAVETIDQATFNVLTQMVVLNQEDMELLGRNLKPGVDLQNDVQRNVPLSNSAFKFLQEKKLALPEKILKRLYLPEQLASILYTRGRLMFYVGFAGNKQEYIQYLKLSCYIAKEVFKDTSYRLLHLLISGTNALLYLRLEKDGKDDETFKTDCEFAYEKYESYLNSTVKYYEHGILKEDGKTSYNMMRCYKQMIKANHRAMELQSSGNPKENRFEVCLKLKKLIEDHPEYAKTALESLIVAAEYCAFGKKFGLAIEFYRKILDKVKNEEEKFRKSLFRATIGFSKVALKDIDESRTEDARKNLEEASQRCIKARLLVPRQEVSEELQKVITELDRKRDLLGERGGKRPKIS